MGLYHTCSGTLGESVPCRASVPSFAKLGYSASFRHFSVHVSCSELLSSPSRCLPASHFSVLIFYHCPHSSHPSTVTRLSSWAWSNLRAVTLVVTSACVTLLLVSPLPSPPSSRCSLRPTLTPYLILQPPHTPLLLFFCSTCLHHLPHHLRLCLGVHRGRVWVPPFPSNHPP